MKWTLLNVGALICAIAIFASSVAYAGEKAPIIEEEVPIEADFWKDDDLHITDLVDDPSSEEVSSQPSSEEESSEPSSEPSSTPSSDPSSTPSSGQESSQPTSGTPVKAPVSSTPPPSSEPPVSSEPPPPPSSEPSSEEESSEPEPPSEPEDTGEDYSDLIYTLAGAVQREIIGTNTVPKTACYEAYKAQAVASHSYMEYYRQLNGSYPQMSFSTPKQATLDLVSEVVDELMYYNGKVINASYHAASGGHTQSAEYIWGSSVGYLKAVPSGYDDYVFESRMSVSAVDNALANADIYTSGDPADWFDLSGASLTDGGFVEYISICGYQTTGRKLRESILGISNLKSNKITSIYVSGDTFHFTTQGYGHGAGMSQQGALGYAEHEGWSYTDILHHYYSGIEIY